MLDGMRRMSQGLVGRIIMGIVMGFISLSFAIWGVGNIFVGYGAGKVAQVGDAEVSTDELRQQYQTQLQNLQQQARRSITNDQARAMGLDRQVLGQLVADASLDSKARKLGLAISDSAIAAKILVDPMFQGPTGKFDPSKFAEVLRQGGFSEASFVREQRKFYLRQEIADAVTGELIVPDATLEAIHRFRDETRSIEYFELPAKSVGEIAPPDDATLQAYFDGRKQGFRAPEYRGLVTLAITPTKLADPASVSDADAQALYDRVKEQRFGTPATRQAEQIVFPDEAKAKEASDKIKAGAAFADVAKEFNVPVADLGVVKRADIFDKAIGDAVFALAAGGVSEPVKGQFGFAITHVTAATEATVKPFAEVSGEIKEELAKEHAKKQVDTLRDKIEDERTSGKSLEDAAAAAGQKPLIIKAIDQSGLDAAGAPVADLVERDALLKAAFASNVGVDNETLNTRDGGYVWFEVTGVEAARDRTLAEVREKVIDAWRGDEIARKLGEKATELVKRIDGGESVEAVAKSLSLEAKNVPDVRRVGTTSVPQGVVIRVFNLPNGAAGSAAADGDGRVVFKILDSVTPPLDKDSDIMKSVRQQLKQAYSEDLLTEYLAKIQADAGVTINQAEFRAATGASDTGAP